MLCFSASCRDTHHATSLFPVGNWPMKCCVSVPVAETPIMQQPEAVEGGPREDWPSGPGAGHRAIPGHEGLRPHQGQSPPLPCQRDSGWRVLELDSLPFCGVAGTDLPTTGVPFLRDFADFREKWSPVSGKITFIQRKRHVGTSKNLGKKSFFLAPDCTKLMYL